MVCRAHPRTTVHFVATGTLSRFATGVLPVVAEAEAPVVAEAGRLTLPDRGWPSYRMQAGVRCSPLPPIFCAWCVRISGGTFDPVYRRAVKGKLLTERLQHLLCTLRELQISEPRCAPRPAVALI